MDFSVLVLVLMTSINCSYSNGNKKWPPLYLDDSPITVKLGGSVTVNCTMPGFGVDVQPMFARWQRRTGNNNAAYVTISNDMTATPGYPRISVQMLPGGETAWYRLTIKDFQPEDTGTYKCMTLGPTHDVQVSSGTVQVIV